MRGAKFNTNWKDSIEASQNNKSGKKALLERLQQRKHYVEKASKKTTNKPNVEIVESENFDNIKVSTSKPPCKWLCNDKEKLNSSLRKAVLDIANSTSNELYIKPICFWPIMPTNVVTIAVITAITRYINQKDFSQIAPTFIYPFFPFDISRLNATGLNWSVAQQHILGLQAERKQGFSAVENGLLSFVATANKNENVNLTCSDVSAINYFDIESKSWKRKRNPFHSVRTTEVLVNETKRRLRDVRKQGELTGIANLYGLPINWDFESSDIKKVLQNKKVAPEFMVDLSISASRRVGGHSILVKKLLRGLKKLVNQLNGNVKVTILSDHPEAVIFFKKQWDKLVKSSKKSKRGLNHCLLLDVKGFCNQGLEVTSRNPFKDSFSLLIKPHIHGQHHYQLCYSFYEKMKVHLGNNHELAPVTTLYRWLLQAGSSLISDNILADFLELNDGINTNYLATNYSAPTVLTNARRALNQVGLANDLRGILEKVEAFQQSQALTTDATKLLLNLLETAAGTHPNKFKLMTTKSRLLGFAIDKLLAKLDEPVPHIHELNSYTLEGANWLVINGFNDKTVRAIFMNAEQLTGIDWLLSLQDAKKLCLSLKAILDIPDYKMFHSVTQQLYNRLEDSLGQFKQSPVLATASNWPRETQSINEQNSVSFKPTAKLAFVNDTSLFIGNSSDLLRFDSSNAITQFKRVKSKELQIGDDILLVDNELKSLFISAIPEQHRAEVLGAEDVVSQYRVFTRNILAKKNITDVKAAIKYSRSKLQTQFPQSSENITATMLRYWCEGIFIDEVKSAPRASHNERYFIDFSVAIGIERSLAEMSYKHGFCITRGNRISQGKKENLALSQILIDRTVSRNYGIPEEKVNEIVELATLRINQISSITPV